MYYEACVKIEELRAKLNALNSAGAPFDEILELSEELDAWIVSAYRD